jgi:cell division protein FtsW
MREVSGSEYLSLNLVTKEIIITEETGGSLVDLFSAHGVVLNSVTRRNGKKLRIDDSLIPERGMTVRVSGVEKSIEKIASTVGYIKEIGNSTDVPFVFGALACAVIFGALKIGGFGLGDSYQKHLWLPESQNDFIFAIVCEELGMVGAFTLIALFMLLMWRGFVIAIKAPDTFSSMLVMGLTLKVSIQAILNIAVVTTTIPTTGIALPFFSYGGTALVMQLAEMGIILSISRFSSGEKNIFENKQRNYQPI